MSLLKVTLVLALAIALGAGAAALALGVRSKQAPDPSPRQADALAHRADGLLLATIAEANVARDLDGLVRLGERADGRAEELRSLLGRTSSISNLQYRRPTEAAIAAAQDALRAFGRLGEMDAPTARDAQRIEADSTRAQSALDGAARRWPPRSNANAAGVGRRAPQLEQAARAVARQLRRIDRRLRSWRVRVVQARCSRRAALGVLDSYTKSFRSYLRQYQALRTETQTFVAETDQRGKTFDDAYEFLSEAVSGRESIRRGMATLDAPSRLAGPHNAVVSSIDTAIEAMNDAYDGVSDYQVFRDDFESYKDTPGWRRFARKSDALVSTYASAVAAWERSAERARRAVARKTLPQRPEV